MPGVEFSENVRIAMEPVAFGFGGLHLAEGLSSPRAAVSSQKRRKFVLCQVDLFLCTGENQLLTSDFQLVFALDKADHSRNLRTWRMATEKEVTFYEDTLPAREVGVAHKVFEKLESALVEATGGVKVDTPWLDGNYAPVIEEVDGPAELVQGEIPKELFGAYLRTGYNAALRPKAGYHPFEQDGMVHMVRLREDGVTYGNRFVRTKRFEVEEKIRRPIGVRISDLVGMRGLGLIMLKSIQQKLGVIPGDGLATLGYGTANTAIEFQNGQLLALQEGDAPFALQGLCSGIVETVGLVPELSKGTPGVSAHPKTDPETGDVYNFSYKVDSKPYQIVSCIGKDRELKRTIELNSMTMPTLAHDMALSENHIIVAQTSLEFDLKSMIVNNTMPIGFNDKAPTRIGVLPKDATNEDDIKWFQFDEPSWISHFGTAWEEGSKLYTTAVRFNGLDFDTSEGGGTFDHERILSLYTMDLETGECSYRPMHPPEMKPDFPVYHPAVSTRKTRYVWCAVEDAFQSPARFRGITKFDVQAAVDGSEETMAGQIRFGENICGGEMSFVPRHENIEDGDGEDDGFLVGYIHNDDTGVSYFAAYDAKTMDPNPICLIQTPQRVPYGLHGRHISEAEFQTQLTAPSTV